MAALSNQDAVGLIEILAAAADPNRDASLEARRRILFSALAEAIEADAWIWMCRSADEAAPVDGTHGKLDDGWADDQQREAAFQTLGQCPLRQLLAAVPLSSTGAPSGVTRTKNDLIESNPNQEAGPESAWRAVGVNDFIVSLYPIDYATYSAVGYCRRDAEKQFTDRDRSVLDVLFQHVAWLHTESPIQLGLAPTSALSPREKEVLVLLLEGYARKEVAARLHLSAHTVADYLKVIYKKLGVSSRAELLAKFIHNS
ncbi:MAG TPA: helix-turn-helix transcriptional regulator [Lacipirellula sp.]